MAVGPTEVAALLAAGGALGAAFVKMLDLAVNRWQRAAVVAQGVANVRATEQQVAATEVTMLREIIGEVRTSEAKKTERIDNLERRLDLLEERERHMLTRAAVHEAWDQMAFAMLSQINPDHPAPPPLMPRQNRRQDNDDNAP
jgi:hypothetical protein